MAERRVLADINRGGLRLVITEVSRVEIEPLGFKFQTIEHALEYVTIHPELFSSDVYAALLEWLEALGGGGLWKG